MRAAKPMTRPRAFRSVEAGAEPVLRRRHHLMQPGLLLGALRLARVGGGHLEPGLGGQLLHRVHEREAALVGHPADHVAVRAAAEAVVEALLVADREARRLLVVERAAGLPLAPRLGELGRAHDHAGQRHACAQVIEPLGT